MFAFLDYIILFFTFSAITRSQIIPILLILVVKGHINLSHFDFFTTGMESLWNRSVKHHIPEALYELMCRAFTAIITILAIFAWLVRQTLWLTLFFIKITVMMGLVLMFAYPAAKDIYKPIYTLLGNIFS